MDRMVKKLSQQMQEELASRTLGEEGARGREERLGSSFRRQVDRLEGEVSTERALHAITRNSLQAVEQDSARLRAQLYSLRQTSPSPNKYVLYRVV